MVKIIMHKEAYTNCCFDIGGLDFQAKMYLPTSSKAVPLLAINGVKWGPL